MLRFAQVFLCSRTQPPVRVRAAGALPPRLFASLSAPRGRGATRPYPRTPTRGKLSLQAFARCARVLRFAQVFLCWRTEPPAVCDKSCSPLSPVVKCARQAILDLS